MRNALQLLGGVAVAGVVAAGTTAFTASGVALGGTTGTGVASGGAVSFNVNGVATLMAATIVQDATDHDRLTGATVTLVDTASSPAPIPDSAVAKISAKFTGTGGTGTTAWGTCVVDTGTDDGIFLCAVPGGYFTALTSVQVSVTI